MTGLHLDHGFHPDHESLDSLRSNINAAYATRYLTLIGAILLLHDHVLTFRAERRLIWTAPASFAKYAFLVNRYLVPASLISIAVEMSGFQGIAYTDDACRYHIFVVAMLAICSTALGQCLVLMRVVLLWDGSRKVALLLILGFIASHAAGFTTFVIALLRILDGIQWAPGINMCIVEKTTPILVATWASPLLFEICVLSATCWNAIDRPRATQQSLTSALYRDGITFFLTLTTLRIINVSLAATQKPALAMVGVFIIWALVTLVLNRSLLNLRQAELSAIAPEVVEEELRVQVHGPMQGRQSPFGLGAPAGSWASGKGSPGSGDPGSMQTDTWRSGSRAGLGAGDGLIKPDGWEFGPSREYTVGTVEYSVRDR